MKQLTEVIWKLTALTGFFLAASAPARAAGIALIGNPTVAGTGCQAGSASVRYDSINDLIQIDGQVWEVEANTAVPSDRKTCTAAVPLRALPGLQIYAVNHQHFLGLQLGHQSQLTLLTEIFTPGTSSPQTQVSFSGPKAGLFEIHGPNQLSAIPLGGCGTDTVVRINSSLLISQNQVGTVDRAKVLSPGSAIAGRIDSALEVKLVAVACGTGIPAALGQRIIDVTPQVVVTPTPSPTIIVTPTPTPTVTVSPQPSPTVTMSPIPTTTPTPNPSVTFTPLPVPSGVPSPTVPPAPKITKVLTPLLHETRVKVDINLAHLVARAKPFERAELIKRGIKSFTLKVSSDERTKIRIDRNGKKLDQAKLKREAKILSHQFSERVELSEIRIRTKKKVQWHYLEVELMD
ncbi:MAG: DUF4360 domain-containing protein [Bdellovibrionales bacterium]|nr:DUF4360 domain-containing protein [Bdellovibrionales bacterium]